MAWLSDHETPRKPVEIWLAHAPRIGQPVFSNGACIGYVTAVEGEICYTNKCKDHCFIWCFAYGLNRLHEWPGKSSPREGNLDSKEG